MESKIIEKLESEGISRKYSGYERLKKAINYAYNDVTYLTSFTTRLYPAVASESGIGVNGAMASMRYTIKACGSEKTLKQFISEIVNELRNE